MVSPKRLTAIASILMLGLSMLLPLAVPAHAKADSPNLISNASVETPNASNSALPQAWQKDSWGTNTPKYTYLKSGQDGTHSVQVQITKYTSGDAKWYFDPVAVQAGSQYTFSDYYQSGVQSDVVAQFDDGHGNYTYQDLGSAAKSTAWKQYSTSFTVPSSAVHVTVFHLINRVGTLTTDNFSLTANAPTPPPAPGDNLIANASVETADPNNSALPQTWSQDKWGTNKATFSYPTSGQNGQRSVSVKMTSYTSGDAKWYFKPVSVQPNTRYTFSDYYQANVQSEVVVQFDDGAGNYTYQDIGTVPASTSWKQFTASFTPPSTAVHATVFHLINTVGTLTTDNFSLTAAAPTSPPPPSPPATNLVPNPSLETPGANPALPANWYEGAWGNNTTAFSYQQSGHSGNRSVGITMSNFVDGGANWTYDAPAVQPGAMYEFSDYYQSNTTTQVLVAVTMSNGSVQYLWLGNPYISDGTWAHFSATFTMPAGAVSAVVYQSISANGYFKADDFDLHAYTPTGFSNAMVSITFDDSIASQYTNGLPVLQQYGLKGTFYVISGDVGICDPSVSSVCYMTQAQVKALHQAGQEIGSHTVDHPDLTTLTTAQVDQELSQSQATLQQWLGGVPVTDFAAPYGSVNTSVLNEVGKYYVSQRGVQIGYNSIDNYNQQNLLVQDINSSTTVAQVESYIQYAQATHTWLILMYHDINTDDSADPGYNTTPTDFAAEMAYLKNSGVNVVTINQGIQLAGPQAQ